MKASLLLFTILLFLKIAFAQNQSGKKFQDSTSESDWLNQAQSFIAKSEYNFKNVSAFSFACANRAQKVVYTITNNGYSVSPLNFANVWKTSFSVYSISKGRNSFKTIANPVLSVKNNYLVQQYQNFSIEYTNDENGLRQDFIINKKPIGSKNLDVKISLKDSNLSASLKNAQVLELQNNGKTILRYDALKVWDANKNLVNAHMELINKNILDIIVDDENAVYPLTIDPLNHTAEWSVTAQGILPSILGQTAIDAAYGYSLVGLGDINGDGYADVAIGAPGLINIISGTGTLASVGAVFVYYGGSKGLSPTPSAELQPSTCVAGALFGYSIAAGDIDGDGVNDIIVGAPLDKITISAGLGTASGTVGKIYAFSGANLTSTVTTPLLTLQLNGSSIIQSGINLNINALFGFSVAVADDLNGDNKNDIIVGSPMYAGITTGLFGSIADVQSGAAFVFLSNGANYNLVKLNPPTSSLLGLGLLSTNINGLLFGMSVDGAGDYNGDGHTDVVVGAPAGFDLGSISSLLTGQLLQGSALIYYGTGSGINAQPGATLAASSGGLLTNFSGTIANVANLFGFSVKGVRNAAGARTGNILVGAPLGGALTNLLSGLQVKTGTVSIFKKNASASGIITPDQQLTSPRNDNTILNTIQSSLLFGFSMDNLEDVNCDGVADIVIGEPATLSTQIVGGNVAGGAAYVFIGNTDGTYQSTPAWTLDATYDATLGVNVTSLIGYSVAGAFKVRGVLTQNKVLVGAPGKTLDFGSGLLNLGNTLGTLFGLAAGDNGPGKAYEFDVQLCGPQSLPLMITNFNATLQNNQQVLVNWSVSSETEVNYYIVERSVNGKDWDSLTTVVATHTTDGEKNYSFTDDNPSTGISYYRIKQTDLNADIFYSESKEIDNNQPFTAGVKVTNPFSDAFTVQLNSLQQNNGMLELMDLNGKRISNQKISVGIGVNTYQINNLTMLARGVYILHVINGNDNYTTKLIKE